MNKKLLFEIELFSVIIAEKKMTSEKKKKEITGLLFYLSLIVLPLIQFVIFYIVVNANSIALAFKHYEYKDGQLLVTPAHLSNFAQVINCLLYTSDAADE